MAECKSSMTDRSDELTTARNALKDADASVQRLSRMATATNEAVKALLSQTDGVIVRMSILDLIDRLAEEACTVMNDINFDAEQSGCNYIDEQRRSMHGAVCSAVSDMAQPSKSLTQ